MEDIYVDKVKKPTTTIDIRDTVSGYQTAAQVQSIIDEIIGND